MIKKSILYISIVYLTQTLIIVLNILLIRNLSLEHLGQITLAKIYFQFMDYMHLGSRFVMDRYVPTSNNTQGMSITNFTIILSFISSIAVVSIVNFFIDDDWVILVFMISGFVFAQGTIYKAYFRAREKTMDMIIVVLITSFFPLLIQLIAVLFFDFKVFVLSFLLAYMVGFILLVYKFRLIKLMSFSSFVSKVKSFYRDSLLLFVISLVIFLSFSIDKILLERYKGNEALGEYSVILFVFATLFIIPGALAELVFPKIIKKVRVSSKVIYLKEMAFVFFPTLLAIITANLLMNYFIKEFTDYAYLLHYLHLVSWAALPYALISILYHTFNALDLRVVILKINVFVFVLYLVYLYLSLKYSSDILQLFVEGRILYGLCLLLMYFLYLSFFIRRKNA